MHEFLRRNRAAVVARCEGKIASRLQRAATPDQLNSGIPLFVDQLIAALEAEEQAAAPPRPQGKQLLELGYTVNQVVHDYADLCQVITDLAVERDTPCTVDEFRSMSRCLDNAIADAVTEFSEQRDIATFRRQSAQAAERLGFFVHEVRNSLHTATLALAALETGSVPFSGATGAVLRRSLMSLTALVDRTVEEARVGASPEWQREVFPLAAFMAEAGNAALLEANSRGSPLTVSNVDAALEVEGHRELLLAAVANLLKNAFKFTHPGTEVSLNASAGAGAVFVDIEDHCGGLPPQMAEHLFKPFAQHHADKSGLGLGLSISRKNVEDGGGTLSVRDLPGQGCVFTIRLPLHRRQPEEVKTGGVPMHVAR